MIWDGDLRIQAQRVEEEPGPGTEDFPLRARLRGTWRGERGGVRVEGTLQETGIGSLSGEDASLTLGYYWNDWPRLTLRVGRIPSWPLSADFILDSGRLDGNFGAFDGLHLEGHRLFGPGSTLHLVWARQTESPSVDQSANLFIASTLGALGNGWDLRLGTSLGVNSREGGLLGTSERHKAFWIGVDGTLLEALSLSVDWHQTNGENLMGNPNGATKDDAWKTSLSFPLFGDWVATFQVAQWGGAALIPGMGGLGNGPLSPFSNGAGGFATDGQEIQYRLHYRDWEGGYALLRAESNKATTLFLRYRVLF